MYTIKQASRLTGVPPATLRGWEQRYDVIRPVRNDAGYRVYDKGAIAVIIGLRKLIESGWSPSEAAQAIREGTVEPSSAAATDLAALTLSEDPPHVAAEAFHDFLQSAARLDSVGIEDSLNRAFTLGPFEFVAEKWLFPALVALGDGWACGQIDVAGEHLASQAVRRRLAAAFEAAGWRSRGPTVLVGLPSGAHHELGGLAVAVATKRRGLDVHFVGSDLPARSWVAAVEARDVDAAVLAVPMIEDRRAARAAAQALRSCRPELLVAVGGAHAADLTTGVLTLPPCVSVAADELEELLHRRISKR